MDKLKNFKKNFKRLLALSQIASHHGIAVSPDARDKGDTGPIRRLLSKFIRRHYPGVDPEPAIEESCMYTVTPDRTHILDRHPEHGNVVVAAGFSGTGFKLGPITGQMVADMAMGRETKYSLEPFRAGRFGERKEASKL